MADGVSGVEIETALLKSTTWNTALPAGADDGMLVLPTSVKKTTNFEKDDSLGIPYSKDADQGPIEVNGDIPCYLRYDGLDRQIAIPMGIAGVPTQQEATAAYVYVYDWADHIDGLFGTFVKHMKTYIEEHTSIKISGITIKGETGLPVQLILHTDSVNKITDSAVNTLATFNNVTFFERSKRVLYSHAVFRMNNQEGAALGGGDVIYPSSFELMAKRAVKGEHTGEFKSSQNNDLIDEPCTEDQPEITLKLNFPRHSGKTLLEDLDNDQYKKIDITFTGSQIETPYNREFKIELSNVQITNDDPADETGAIKEPLDLMVHGCEVAPTGMAFTTPLRISGINKRTTDPLA